MKKFTKKTRSPETEPVNVESETTSTNTTGGQSGSGSTNTNTGSNQSGTGQSTTNPTPLVTPTKIEKDIRPTGKQEKNPKKQR